jgi:(p)ppGpp synthase/HD superfamily hydrolase
MAEGPTGTDDSPPLRLGRPFLDALALASELHATQPRKGPGNVPYVAHLLAVAAIVLENGGDEEEAIAALLHDAAEDQGGRPTLERIRRLHGERVAGIVEACSDTFEDPKPEWRTRKEAYIERLREAPRSVRLVAAADKLHNVQGLLADIEARGALAFRRFKHSTRHDQVWYFKACGEALLAAEDASLPRRVARAARRLEEAVARLDAEEDRRPPDATSS